VLLNKGDEAARFHVTKYLQPGRWRAALGGEAIEVAAGGALEAGVGPHDVAVYLLDAPATRGDLAAELVRLMRDKGHPDD
jgi:cyclomaltodextrin glucanotransferase